MRFQKYPDTCGRGLNLNALILPGNMESCLRNMDNGIRRWNYSHVGQCNVFSIISLPSLSDESVLLQADVIGISQQNYRRFVSGTSVVLYYFLTKILDNLSDILVRK